MKKKHRDIVVDGQQYGWMVDGCNHVRIWLNKKVVAEFDVPYEHDRVTPKIVAGLISDPINTMLWLSAEGCPFCGVLPVRSEDMKYLVVHHEDDCWLDGVSSINMNRTDIIDVWNKRH
jgi:hypothetical protein